MDQVAEVKQKTDIVSVIGGYVELKKAGRHHKGLCPFHSEKTPSFVVNDELGLYKCFGCGAGGDVIKFLMEIEGMDFVEALRDLADRVGVKLEFKKIQENEEKKEIYEVMDLAARFYHYLLTEHDLGKEARDYLKERKIDKKLIETFNLGFALPSWDSLVKYLIYKKGYKEELLERCGLVVKRSGGNGSYDKFRGRIMFPLFDSSGRVIGFSGRILPKYDAGETAKYMNSPETEIYHKGKNLYGFFQAKKEMREKKQVVVVEGMLDLISSYGAGVGETVAVGGTSMTPEQVEMVARLADKIIFAMDADTAGEASVKRSVELAEKRGMNIKVVHIVGAKDPDEIARNNPKEWREMVDSAVTIYEYVIKRSIARYPREDEDRVRNVAREVIPYLAKIDQEMIKNKWIKKVALELEVDKESIELEMERYRRGLPSVRSMDKKQEVEKVDLMGVLLGWLIVKNDKKLVERIKKMAEGVNFGGGDFKLLKLVIDNADKLDKILDFVPDELKEYLAEVLMKNDLEVAMSDKDVEKIAIKVMRSRVESLVDELQKEIDLAEKKGKNDKAEELSVEVVRLNKKSAELGAILA